MKKILIIVLFSCSVFAGELTDCSSSEDIIASRISGTWLPAPALTKALSPSLPSHAQVKELVIAKDDSVKAIFEEYLKGEAEDLCYHYLGRMKAELEPMTIDYPILLTEHKGNKIMLVYSPEYKDILMFFYPQVGRAEDSAEDILFLGGQIWDGMAQAFKRDVRIRPASEL